MIGNQGNSYLSDRHRQGVMYLTGSITCLDAAIKEQATMDALQGCGINPITSSIDRRVLLGKSEGKHLRANTLTKPCLFLNDFCNLFLESLIHSHQIFTRKPCIKVERISE